jgi:hypothetical protein
VALSGSPIPEIRGKNEPPLPGLPIPRSAPPSATPAGFSEPIFTFSPAHFELPSPRPSRIRRTKHETAFTDNLHPRLKIDSRNIKTRLLTVLAVCILCTACQSISPLKSKPPYKDIVVNRPFSVGNIAFKINLPVGVYTPQFEDEDGYYYQAPQKLSGHDAWRPLIVDGGIYLERDVIRPEKIYYIEGDQGTPIKPTIWDQPDLKLDR